MRNYNNFVNEEVNFNDIVAKTKNTLKIFIVSQDLNKEIDDFYKNINNKKPKNFNAVFNFIKTDLIDSKTKYSKDFSDENSIENVKKINTDIYNMFIEIWYKLNFLSQYFNDKNLYPSNFYKKDNYIEFKMIFNNKENKTEKDLNISLKTFLSDRNKQLLKTDLSEIKLPKTTIEEKQPEVKIEDNDYKSFKEYMNNLINELFTRLIEKLTTYSNELKKVQQIINK